MPLFASRRTKADSLYPLETQSSPGWPARVHPNGKHPASLEPEALSPAVPADDWSSSSASDRSNDLAAIRARGGRFPTPPNRGPAGRDPHLDNFHDMLPDRAQVSLADPNSVSDVPPLAITEDEQKGKEASSGSRSPKESFRPIVDRPSHPVSSEATTPTVEEVKLEPLESVLRRRKERDDDYQAMEDAPPRLRRSFDVSTIVSSKASSRYPPTSAERSTASRPVTAPNSSPSKLTALPALLRPPALPTSRASPPFPTPLSIVEAGPSRYRGAEVETDTRSPSPVAQRPPSSSYAPAPSYGLERYSLSAPGGGRGVQPRVTLPPPAALLAPLRRESSQYAEEPPYYPARPPFNHEHSHGSYPDAHRPLPLSAPPYDSRHERPRSPPPPSSYPRYSLAAHGSPPGGWDASPPRRLASRTSMPQLPPWSEGRPEREVQMERPPPLPFARRPSYEGPWSAGPSSSKRPPQYASGSAGPSGSGMTGYEVRRDYAFGDERRPSEPYRGEYHLPPRIAGPPLEHGGHGGEPNNPSLPILASGAPGHRVESRTKAGLIGLSRTVQGRTYREYP